MTQFLCHNQSSRQPRLGPDAGESHPGKTAGESRMFQGEGAPSRTPLVPPYHDYPLHHDSRAPPTEQSGLLQLLKLLRNPPRLVGFRLALLHLAHVMTRRPVRVSRSRQLVTPLQLGWLSSFMRSALSLTLSSIRRL